MQEASPILRCLSCAGISVLVFPCHILNSRDNPVLRSLFQFRSKDQVRCFEHRWARFRARSWHFGGLYLAQHRAMLRYRERIGGGQRTRHA